MGNHHHHHHHIDPSKEGQNGILLAFGLNFTFAIVEIIGGIYTNSMAVISDAIHDLGDSVALLSAYFLEKLSLKNPDKKFTYGYRRFSVLSAIINSMILLFGAIFVVKESIERISSPEPIKPEGVIVLALLGIAVNGFAAYKLSKNEGINQKVVMYHLLEDIFGWVAVLFVSIILLFKPWYVLDSILSIIISLVILKGVYGNFKQGVGIFLQKFPENIKLDEMIKSIKNISGVSDVHFVQGWSLDGLSHAMNFHVAVSPEMTVRDLDKLKLVIRDILKENGILNSSLEFESSDFECVESQKH